MADSLDALEARRADLLEQIRKLGDFRPGSITVASGRSITEWFPTEAARLKAERETSEYRKWQELSREFVEVNTAICRLRPLKNEESAPREKKRHAPSHRKSRKAGSQTTPREARPSPNPEP